MPARPPFRRLALASAATATGLLAAAVAPAAAMSTDQSYWVPVSRQIVVRGHGFGHGHGMSQYGAQGAASQGLGYQDIADFYYPGTTWSKVSGKIRVLISADTTSDVVVSPAAGLTVRDLGDGQTYALPDLTGVQRWRLSVDAGNHEVLAYQNPTGWHPWAPADKAVLVGDGEFFGPTKLTLWTPYGARSFRGALRAASPSSGATYRDTVNVLPMDSYVKGVVPYEMPASWNPEAVKAQAVAARTYATWSRDQHPTRYYQVCDTTSCQVYGGAGGEDSRSNAAVDATARQILTYGGRAAFTQFSASNGGWTSSGGVAYLPAEADPYDGWAGNPVHDWSLTVDAGRLERYYPAIGSLRRIRVVARDGNGEWDGRVSTVVLDGTRSDLTLSGDRFQSFYGLRSRWFSVDPTPIIARWTRIGGSGSVLGAVTTGEYVVPGGAAQGFSNGRIFYSPGTGARELYGAVLDAYQRLGGPGSALGLPRTAVRARRTGFRALFRGGTIWSNAETGTVGVLGAISDRYLAEGGLGSGLGWPIRGNFSTALGERVNFQHGYITWSSGTGATDVRITG
jgi:stage II sporulation protein D